MHQPPDIYAASNTVCFTGAAPVLAVNGVVLPGAGGHAGPSRWRQLAAMALQQETHTVQEWIYFGKLNDRQVGAAL